MSKRVYFLLLFAWGVGVLFISCSRHPSAIHSLTTTERLQSELERLFSAPEFANAHWGVAIQSLVTGDFLYLRNADKGFMPASNMKLFTSSAVLVGLGPDYHYHTTLFATAGPDSNGILAGDLIIRGSGDPSISGRYFDGDITHVLDEWARALKKLGITSIEGNIIGDDNAFEDEIMGHGWSWDYQTDYYAAQISALSLNDNCVDLIFSPGDSAGSIANLEMIPPTDYIVLENRVITTDDPAGTRIRLHRERNTNHILCSGTIDIDENKVVEWATVENPTKYTVRVFREILMKHGIMVKGVAVDIDELTGYNYSADSRRVLHDYISPPMSIIVETINKKSQNLFAELVLRTLGKEITGRGSAKAGVKASKSIFTEMGIHPDYLVMVDGSGLSRKNLVTPLGVITLLRFMRQHQYGEFFYDTLPIAGVDGTIYKRMRNTAAYQNVRAKTGTIDRCRALSGYVNTRDGEELVFSMIVNNHTVPTSLADRIQDLVCERLANFSR